MPPGRRPQISRAYLEAHRRRRFVDAAAELLHEFGREGPTVTNLVRLAGTARNSFYEIFRSAEDCISYGVDLVAGEMLSHLDAGEGEGDWSREVEAAVEGFYGAVAERPLHAELFLVHSAACRSDLGREALPRSVDRLAALLGRGRAEAEARGLRPPPALADEYLAWVIATLPARRVREDRIGGLPGESEGVAGLVCGYYLGAEAAGPPSAMAPRA